MAWWYCVNINRDKVFYVFVYYTDMYNTFNRYIIIIQKYGSGLLTVRLLRDPAKKIAPHWFNVGLTSRTCIQN